MDGSPFLDCIALYNHIIVLLFGWLQAWEAYKACWYPARQTHQWIFIKLSEYVYHKASGSRAELVIPRLGFLSATAGYSLFYHTQC